MKRAIYIGLCLLLSSNFLFADNLGLKTVVIDAGHGGKDPGCISKDKKTYEKTITLEIAQSLEKYIKSEYPDIKVVQTRNKDVFVSLNDRAEIANKVDADLFISIHINSTTTTAANGYSVHILGQSNNSSKDYVAYNMDVVKRENSVILLEEDYNTKYQGFDPSDPESYIFLMLMQNSYREQSMRFSEIIRSNLKSSAISADRGIWQNGFYVLWKTSMPSVLVELGFISNPKDLEALRIQSNRNELAKRLFKAFKEYKSIYDASIGVNTNSSNKSIGNNDTAAKETTIKETTVSEETIYAVQIFATSKTLGSKDKVFLGYSPKVIKSGSLNKYYIGLSKSEKEVREKYTKIKAKYPDAFLVKIKGESVSRL